MDREKIRQLQAQRAIDRAQRWQRQYRRTTVTGKVILIGIALVAMVVITALSGLVR
ncbi:hypothetical protein [Spongiactinospora gelatinilytica]|uniref:hypothetical protein n=1 Tax=Spongiactinospora gelatinilytica TaxID=2666298 RepID=UPI001314EFB7|nr:hypothetical protein [Spongiactinospora gelatinilytica]